MANFWEWETEEERNKRHSKQFEDYADYSNRKVEAENFRKEFSPPEPHPYGDAIGGALDGLQSLLKPAQDHVTGALDNLQNLFKNDYQDTVQRHDKRINDGNWAESVMTGIDSLVIGSDAANAKRDKIRQWDLDQEDHHKYMKQKTQDLIDTISNPEHFVMEQLKNKAKQYSQTAPDEMREAIDSGLEMASGPGEFVLGLFNPVSATAGKVDPKNLSKYGKDVLPLITKEIDTLKKGAIKFDVEDKAEAMKRLIPKDRAKFEEVNAPKEEEITIKKPLWEQGATEYSQDWINEMFQAVGVQAPDIKTLSKMDAKEAYRLATEIHDAIRNPSENLGIHADIARETRALEDRVIGQEFDMPNANERIAERIRRPEDHALSKMISVLTGKGYDGNYIVPRDVARSMDYSGPGAIFDSSLGKEVEDKITRKFQSEDGRWDFDVTRSQMPGTEGIKAGKTGVFYEKGPGISSYYKRSASKGEEGGSELIEGQTTFNNPYFTNEFVDSANIDGRSLMSSANRVTEIIEAVKTGNVDELEDTLNRVTRASALGEDTKHIAESLMEAYTHANRIHFKNHTVPEVVNAIEARGRGHDAIIGVSNNGHILEIMDLRENRLPGPTGYYSMHPRYEKKLTDSAKMSYDETAGSIPKDKKIMDETPKAYEAWEEDLGDNHHAFYSVDNEGASIKEQPVGWRAEWYKDNDPNDPILPSRTFISKHEAYEYLKSHPSWKETQDPFGQEEVRTGWHAMPPDQMGSWYGDTYYSNAHKGALIADVGGEWVAEWTQDHGPTKLMSKTFKTKEEAYEYLKKHPEFTDETNPFTESKSGGLQGNELSSFVKNNQDVIRSAAKSGTMNAVAAGAESYQEGDDPETILKKALIGAGKGIATKTIATQAAKADMMPEQFKKIFLDRVSNGDIAKSITISKDPESTVEGWRYSSYLSDPATLGNIALGNIGETAIKAIRDGVSAASRGQFKQTLDNEISVAKFWWSVQTPKIWNDFSDTLREASKSKIGIDYLTKVVPKAVQSVDAVMGSILYGMDIAYRGMRVGTAKGLTGTALDDFVKQVVLNPDTYPDIHAAAAMTVKRATLQLEKHEMSEAGESSVDLIKRSKLGWFAPFSRTAAQYGQRMYEFSPIGLIHTLIDMKTNKYGKIAMGDSLSAPGVTWAKHGIAIDGSTVLKRNAEVGERLGNGVIGTTLPVIGIAAAMGGVFTGDGPSDPEKKATMERNGWKANSIATPAGYIPNPIYKTPAGSAMKAVINAVESLMYEKPSASKWEAATNAVRQAARAATDSSVLGSYADIIDLITQRRTGAMGDTLGNVAGSFVPLGGALSAVAKASDPYKRQLDSGVDNQLERARDLVMQKIPGLRNTMTPNLDAMGMPEKNDRFGIGSIPGVNFLNTKRVDPNKRDSELLRLNIDIGEVPSKIGDMRLSKAQRARYQEVAGRAKEQMLSMVMDQDYYKKADDKEKTAIITSVNRRANQWGREAVDPSLVKDAELSAYKNNVDAISNAFVRGLGTKSKIEELKAIKYGRNKTPEQIEQLEQDKQRLTAFVRVLGNSQGKQVFRAKYGSKRLSQAIGITPTSQYTRQVEKIKKGNKEYSFLFGATIGPEDIEGIDL